MKTDTYYVSKNYIEVSRGDCKWLIDNNYPFEYELDYEVKGNSIESIRLGPLSNKERQIVLDYLLNIKWEEVIDPNAYLITALSKPEKIEYIYLLNLSSKEQYKARVINGDNPNSLSVELNSFSSDSKDITHVPIKPTLAVCKNNYLECDAITNNSLVPNLWQALESII